MTDFLEGQAYTFNNESRKGEGRIYLDAVWLLNILMDGMILYLTQGLTRTKTSAKRVMFGALFASIIVPITVYLPHSWFTTSLGKLFFSFVIIFIAFSFVSIRSWLVQLVSFYFITFAIGGSMLGIHYFLSSDVSFEGSTMITHNAGYGDPVSWIFVIIGFPISWFFTKWRLEHVSLHRMKLEEIYDVSINWNGKTAECKGLVDSGNQLIDPVSRKMVFLADGNVFNQFLNAEEFKQLEVENILSHFDDCSELLQSSIRLVPYQGAGMGGQLLVTLLVDRITVKTKEGSLVIENPLLGVQHHDLTHDRLYQVLIHPHLMVRGKSA
ncbi:sigma-E processing peptidase SpoIIGA [Halobacillus rhizosphaerae]|uniref:sigma-E processing peptidase SpoIIGA n=1 Tax=Halobacillus rhizosphaerae TaxID=3064889 RepID=UPI00398A94C5